MTVSYYSEKFQVPFFECDAQGMMHLSALMDHLVLASEHQLQEFGAGPTQLAAMKLGWVTTEYQINIQRLPKQHEFVTAKTGVPQFNKFFCYRDYFLIDEAGDEIVTIHSIWVIMSFATRRMIQLPVKELHLDDCSEYSAAVVRFPKIAKRDWNQADYQKDYQVRYFDIDSNRHVNNVHYFDWMLDSLPGEFLRDHQITTMLIRYERETRYGEEIVSQTQLEQAPALTTYHRITRGDDVAAEASVTWQAR
ncbi:acyl-[acyl-carrier-protein] thioesterase [Lapidilactobacillus wuchangensis]|uniref:acyl-[acyl-carrier-protein] thioesterase n=1 Tax=Lapidilactobacillus wuchangensis TaxID=2486001 RepID=UPI000F7B0B5D|nr:acyl-ACP thioesterase domain-containing protein [Lapidilactobacillus wuchangensis]